MAEPLRVIIADDNFLVREGTRRLLEDCGEVIVLAAVGSAPELLEATSRTRPDAVLTDIRISAIEIVLGLGAAIIVGIPVGIICGWNKWVYFAVDPWLTILYALPIVALAPLLVNVVGIGLAAKVLLVFLFAVFPIAINTLTGVHATSNQFLSVAQVYGANRGMILRSVVLPGALPFILTGLRLAGGRALVGMVVAEFTAAEAGVGFRLQVAGATLQTGLLFALLALLGLVGVIVKPDFVGVTV